MRVVLLRCVFVAASLVLVAGSAAAQNTTATPHAVTAEVPSGERNISDWLLRMHEASRRRAYIGTFVVTSANTMSSARIWHVCDGEQQMERVETLTGAPRSTFRRNDQVITFHAETKTALAEKRESLGLFPDLLKATDSAIAQFYAAKQVGIERVAGFDADVVQLTPKDNLRFGYRVWSEKKTGLVVKLQTLDAEGRVLEQSAFSELQLDAPVSMSKLSQMMGNVEGYKIEKPELVKTTALAEGWVLKSGVPGFKPMSCFKRAVATGEGSATDSAMQWIFSDGLASVSLFVETFDKQRHGQEGLMAMGATQTLTRRMTDKTADKAGDKSGTKPAGHGGDWWLTLVGEVPAQALMNFAQGLERKK